MAGTSKQHAMENTYAQHYLSLFTCHFHFRAKAAAEETTIVDLKVEIAELKIALDSARSQGNV